MDHDPNQQAEVFHVDQNELADEFHDHIRREITLEGGTDVTIDRYNYSVMQMVSRCDFTKVIRICKEDDTQGKPSINIPRAKFLYHIMCRVYNYEEDHGRTVPLSLQQSLAERALSTLYDLPEDERGARRLARQVRELLQHIDLMVHSQNYRIFMRGAPTEIA